MARNRSPKQADASRATAKRTAGTASGFRLPAKLSTTSYRLVVESAPIGFVAINETE